jgi:cell division protein FtsN
VAASAPDTYPVSLAVQVGSFSVEDNAERLAQSLKQLGYPAEIVQRIDARQRVWYVVRLGPYHKWDTASGIALRLASNQDLSPIVGPM